MYAGVTQQIAAGVAADRFDDSARMEAFAAAFAQRYFDAYFAARDGRPSTLAWGVSFQAARQRNPIVLQHLLLGMNAHINLDLGIVAAEFARRSAGGLVGLRGDFNAVNDVLAGLVDTDQAALNRVSPGMRMADSLGGDSDELIAKFSLRKARSEAWKLAERLVALPDDRWVGEIERTDRGVAGFGNTVLKPGGEIAALLTVIRLQERRSIVSTIDALRGR